jgi:hypothetical protein|tara:strand:- start:2670 stop:3128 length:459 start_codon:yes stop_codon:yes gene_type:complete
MSNDFDGVEWLENITKPASAKELAPVGVNFARIITAEKYKSKSGNWTVKVVFEMNNGTNRDHVEFYNLWAANSEAKRISNEMFTALSKACGFKQGFPGSALELVNKTLDLGIYHKKEKWTNDSGEEVESDKTKIGEYLSPVPSSPKSTTPKL